MKAPAQPDPMQTAAAQSASNRDTAITQQLLNMTNQVTPQGSLTYNQSGQATYKDANGNDVNTPTFTATQTYSPEQQKLYDQGVLADTKMNDVALGQIDRVGGVLGTNFNYDTGEHEKWAGDTYGKLNNDTNQRNTGLLEQKLANQGLQPGSAAYDDAMRNLTYGQDKAYNDFMLSSYDTGMNTALTNRNQPINEISALMSGTGVQQPQFASTPQTGVNGTDVAGLINSNAQQQQNNYQAKLGGMFGLGSAALGGWAMSERKTKTDIKKIGKVENGLNLYKFKYKPEFGGRGLMHIGMMADEVEKKIPDAVGHINSGIRAVNYDRIAEALTA